MKIYTFIRTYAPHEECDELNTGKGPAYYTMQETSLVRSGNPFFVPDFDTEFRAYPSLCLRIGRLGKGIAPRFAGRYIESWTMAVAVVATGLLGKLRSQGDPWSPAVSFDRSCWLGNLQSIDTLLEYGTFKVECGESDIIYETRKLIPSIKELISLLSRDNTLKNGDLILAGLMSRGITLCPGMNMRITENGKLTGLTDIRIR